MIKLKKAAFYGKMHKGAEMLHEEKISCEISGGKYIYISNSAREIATKCLGVCVCVTKSFFSKLFVKSLFATFLSRLFIKSRPKIFMRYCVSLTDLAQPYNQKMRNTR